MKRYTVVVKPRSSQEKIHADTPAFLTVWTRERAADGMANKKVLEMLAEYFDVSIKDMQVIAGHRARIKIVQVDD
jgi:uncharacterized protein YggU (UPF0235/DUF167 family)